MFNRILPPVVGLGKEKWFILISLWGWVRDIDRHRASSLTPVLSRRARERLACVGRNGQGVMPHVAAALFMIELFMMLCSTAAYPGHELPYYPSYYPQEIRLESVEPSSAGPLLQKSAIHAYIGSDPFPSGTLPSGIGAATSLGSYLVLSFNPASESLPDPERRCTAASQLLHALEATQGDARVHPYPVTPYHMDYLHHFDAVESARQMHRDRTAKASDIGTGGMKVRAQGALAETVMPPSWRATDSTWEAVLEEIDLGSLVAEDITSTNGWHGPLWLKEGWYHAHRLLAPHLSDDTAKPTIKAIYQRLTNGHYRGPEERLNLERQLVSLLTQGCERVVVGYTVKHEYYSADFSAGIENIAYDAQAGFNSPIFVRTAKLKDFPWNGWLKLGMQARPAAAWNPIGGFTDAAGRLIWSAIGDPALLLAPHNSTWMANRFTPNIAVAGAAADGISMPPDALLPEPGSGLFRAVSEDKRASVKLTYRGLMSVYHDGTAMAVADLLYPYSMAMRWGMRKPANALEYDPVIDASTALMRTKLAGVMVLGVEQEPKAFGELKLTQEIPVIEVYLNDTSPDFPHIAAIAPPWSTLPWHLMALMEEAVKRGFAAFSMAEAQRRGVAWLDLARDQRLKDRLLALLADFEVQGYRPEALQPLATEAEARQRWGALKSFYLAHGHFLVTNGPYRLDRWDDGAVALQVFRDLSYPLGVGSYDKYAFPPKALIAKLEAHRNRLEISAEMEKVEKAQRSYHLVREPLGNQAMVGVYRVKAVAKYVVLSPQGEVLKAGTAPYAGDGVFAVELQGKVPPGRYTVLITIYVNDNYIDPDVRMISYEVAS
jgi:hypothetical protein